MSESRHLRSVSDLYAADEIEVLLLEEIRDLEPPPAAYSRPEDIQDFEIAGSRTGGRISSQSSELDSPGINSTVHSWDSHANYHGSYGHDDHRHGSSANAMAWPRSSHLIFYCDIQGHLKTATGFIRLLLLLSSAACLATLCSSGTAKVSLFMLPLVGRLRFMIFVAVFCLLITALLLFLDISHVVYFFPFNWARLNAWIFTSVGLSYVTSSALLGLAVFEYHGGGWVPKRTRSQLTATAFLGLSCALLSFALSWLHGRHGSTCHAPTAEDDQNQQLYKPVDSSSSGATLKDRVRSTKQPPPWVAKNSKKHQASVDSNNGNSGSARPRKDHWASARDHFLNSNQFDEELEQAGGSGSKDARRQQQQQQQQQQHQARRREADGTSGSTAGQLTASQTKTSFSTDDSKKKAPPKKLALQAEGGAGTGRRGGGRGSKASETGKKPGTTRTSVTRSEIQEYWMQGYEHVQRTEKTTGNIDQWQSAAMKSLEEKKANDERWVEAWRRQKEQHAPKTSVSQHSQLSQAQSPPSASASQQVAQPLLQPATTTATLTQQSLVQSTPARDDSKPCSSKTLEPLNFA